jgi:hypothetical protein
MKRMLPRHLGGSDGRKNECSEVSNYLFAGEAFIIGGHQESCLPLPLMTTPFSSLLRNLDYISQSFFSKGTASEIIG